MLLLHTMFLVQRTVLSVMVARLDGRIVRDLVKADKKGFARGIMWWFILAIPSTYTNAMVGPAPLPLRPRLLRSSALTPAPPAVRPRSSTCSPRSRSPSGRGSRATPTTSTCPSARTFTSLGLGSACWRRPRRLAARTSARAPASEAEQTSACAGRPLHTLAWAPALIARPAPIPQVHHDRHRQVLRDALGAVRQRLQAGARPRHLYGPAVELARPNGHGRPVWVRAASARTGLHAA